MTHTQKITAGVLAALSILATAGLGRIYWASLPPKLPQGWSANSVWMTGRRLPLSLWPEGAWVNCWLDSQRGVNRCRFANYQGTVFYEGDYAICDGRPPVPTNQLKLRNEGSVWILHLQDGTPLFQGKCREIGPDANRGVLPDGSKLR
jgi:hypothetical protein